MLAERPVLKKIFRRALFIALAPALLAAANTSHLPERTREHAGNGNPHQNISKEKCRTCHEKIYQAKVLHGPVGADACQVCHLETGKNSERIIVRKNRMSCGECHQEITGEKQQPFLHGPFAVDDCTACHDPHGSREKFQLRRKTNDLCLQCHDSLKTKMNEEHRTIHDAIPQKTCIACHSPHAAQYRFLLRKPLNELCLQCHDETRYADKKHPVLKHPTRNAADPWRPGRTMSCISCHDPHVSSNARLLKEKNYLSLCRRCHPGY